jgi:hypothetical protein
MWHRVALAHLVATVAAAAWAFATFRLPLGGQAPDGAAAWAESAFVALSWPLLALSRELFDLQLRQPLDLVVVALVLALNSALWAAVLTPLLTPLLHAWRSGPGSR